MAGIPGIDIVVFLLPVCGSLAFALLIYRFVVREDGPPEPDEPPGGSKVTGPRAGPNDLARSA